MVRLVEIELSAVGQLYDEQITFGDRQFRLTEDLKGSFRVAQDDANDGAIGQIRNRQGDDADIGGLEAPYHIEQRANAVAYDADARKKLRALSLKLTGVAG